MSDDVTVRLLASAILDIEQGHYDRGLMPAQFYETRRKDFEEFIATWLGSRDSEQARQLTHARDEIKRLVTGGQAYIDHLKYVASLGGQ